MEGEPSPATASRSKKSGVSTTAQWPQCELRQQAAANRPPLCLPVEWTETWNAATKSEVRQRDQTAVTLMDLHPAKTYNVRVFAVNSVGRSDASNVLTFTTKEAGKATSCLIFCGETSSSLMEGLLL